MTCECFFRGALSTQGAARSVKDTELFCKYFPSHSTLSAFHGATCIKETKAELQAKAGAQQVPRALPPCPDFLWEMTRALQTPAC